MDRLELTLNQADRLETTRNYCNILDEECAVNANLYMMLRRL